MTQMRTAQLAGDCEVFCGIDVDKKSFAVTFKDRLNMNYSKKMPAEPEYLCNYIKNHFAGRPVLCVYEAGPTGYHLYDHMKQNGQACVITSPITMRRAPNEKVKTNRLDSVKLAEELQAGLLKFVRVPEGPYRELRQLVKSREDYAIAVKKAKQRIKALLLYTHLETALLDSDTGWSNRYIAGLKELECDQGARMRLDMLLADLDYGRRQMLAILRGLKSFFREHPGLAAHLRHLQSIPGIGFVTGTSILARIGDPAGLRCVRELGGFLGLVPKESSTGDRVARSSITHMGNSMLRALMVEAAWVAIRRDKELGQFYHRIRLRHHPGIGARKAIVAVARKLTHRVYCVLKEQRDYIPG